MQLFAAKVTAINGQQMQVSFVYEYKILWVTRCVPCGFTTGLHWMPKIGDPVWIVYMEGGMPIALGGISNYDAINRSVAYQTLEALAGGLQAGETAILGPTGSVLKWVQDGSMTLSILDSMGGMTKALKVNGGTKGVARVGDTVSVSVNGQGGSGTITSGSSDVLLR